MPDQKNERLTIGVLAGWWVYAGAILHGFLGAMYQGIRAAAQEHGCNLLLSCGIGGAIGPWNPAWPVPSAEGDFVPIGPWNTDGLIAVMPLLTDDRVQYIHDLIAAGHPVVFAGVGKGSPSLIVDNEGGINQAMRHLVEHGHRSIAFIAGFNTEVEGDSPYRLQAYRAAVQEYGLNTDSRLVAFGEHFLAGGQRAMQRILDSGAPFTAVLASNDESAFGAIRALKDAGLRVPEDVAVIGFDNRNESLSESPSLTSIHCPTYEMGYRSLELLLQYVTGQKKEIEVARIPTRLVVRQSCGCPPGALSPAAYSAQTSPTDPSGIAEAVLAETQRLSPDVVHRMCTELTDAFVASLLQEGDVGFLVKVEEILRQAEAIGDDPYAWQAAISVLRNRLPALLKARRVVRLRQRAEDLLHQARVAINGSTRRRYVSHMARQTEVSDQLGWMTSRLLNVLDAEQTFDVLAEFLPPIGIPRSDVAFFESKGDDPVAWSALRPIPNVEGHTFRFPSRQFPPPGLYPDDAPFSLALLPLSIQEERVGFVSFDTTDMEPLAAIVRQLASALRSGQLYHEAVEGRRLAEEASRLKSRLLSTVSHELRTPLNVVVGLTDMLLQEDPDKPPLPQEYRQDLERVHTSAQHLDGLIRDVLDLARSEVGQLRLVREPINLAEVFRAAAVVGEQLARDKGLEWRCDIPDDLPQVSGDRTRLRQVALNLLTNAAKFTERGYVALEVSVEDQMVLVQVRDTGLGIALTEQEVIFDEFRQAERTTTRGYGGLGLGLAICRRLVELHGGAIGVQSSGEEGSGSTFYFTLPALESPAPEPQAKAPGQKQTVLLLAEQSGSDKLRERLAQHRFAVEEMAIGQTSDWLTRLIAASPDIVLIDQGAGPGRGWEALRALKSSPATQNVPVLFYALDKEQNGGMVVQLDYLTKPVGTANLVQTMQRQGLTAQDAGAKTILIVDDEPDVLDILARVLQVQLPSCRALKARGGREALEVVQKEKPDLVLLNLMMPEVNGFEVLEAMQAAEATRDVPVVALTRQVLAEHDVRWLNQETTLLLAKGLFSVEEILARIEKALERQQQLYSQAQ